MARGQAALEVKVGIFVFLLIALTVTVIFLLGSKSNLFTEQVTLKTSFKSASGLRVGAQIRLAGVQVGQVGAIHFGDNPRDPLVTVEMKVARAVLPRITKLSRARIDSMGLLGDKIIDISVGEKGEPVEPDDSLEGVAPMEYMALLNTAQDALGDVKEIASRLRALVGVYSNPAIHEDVVGIFSSTRKLLTEAAQGRGLVYTLLFDRAFVANIKGLANDARRALANAGATVSRFGEAGLALTSAFGEVGRILKNIRRGKGTTLHTLLYGKDQVTPVFEAARKAAHTLNELLVKARDGRGLAHAILNEKRGKEILDNLILASRSAKSLTDSLREVGRKVAAGEGSLGALLTDPTLYEDLRSMVGNLRRNRVLRALVRFALERQPAPPPGPVPRAAGQ